MGRREEVQFRHVKKGKQKEDREYLRTYFQKLKMNTTKILGWKEKR